MTRDGDIASGQAMIYLSHIRPAEAGLPTDPGDAPEGGAFCICGAAS
jgi:hypothetical protein